MRRHMLPKDFSPTGTYSIRIIDRTKGYRLLVHAEIESYLEDMARDVAVTQIREWTQKRKASDFLVCFLASYHTGWASDEEDDSSTLPPPSTSGPHVKDAIEEIVKHAMKQYMDKLLKNHGVREKNIKQLLLPIGIRLDDLDATWVTNMDEFGKRRGEVAHKSVGAHQAVDPKTEFDSIVDLMSGLKELDEMIVHLMK